MAIGDTYMKVVLSIIALDLTILAMRPHEAPRVIKAVLDNGLAGMPAATEPFFPFLWGVMLTVGAGFIGFMVWLVQDSRRESRRHRRRMRRLDSDIDGPPGAE
jgi:hypothetical protein